MTAHVEYIAFYWKNADNKKITYYSILKKRIHFEAYVSHLSFFVKTLHGILGINRFLSSVWSENKHFYIAINRKFLLIQHDFLLLSINEILMYGMPRMLKFNCF